MKKNLWGLLIILLVSYSSNAQVNSTRSEIIKSFGPNYTSSYVKEMKAYSIDYEKDVTTKESGTYNLLIIFYFDKDSDTSKCYGWKKYEPWTEINNNVVWIKSKSVYDDGNMKWREYKTDIRYSVSIEDGWCITSSW